MTDFYIDVVQSLEAFRMRFDACLTRTSMLITYMMSACPIQSWLFMNLAFLQPMFSLKKRLLAYSNIFGAFTFQQTIPSIVENYILLPRCMYMSLCVLVCLSVCMYVCVYIYREKILFVYEAAIIQCLRPALRGQGSSNRY